MESLPLATQLGEVERQLVVGLALPCIRVVEFVDVLADIKIILLVVLFNGKKRRINFSIIGLLFHNFAYDNLFLAVCSLFNIAKGGVIPS